MLPSPSPRFYLVGVILSGAGALILALRVGLRKRPGSRPRALLAAGVLALAVGMTVFGAGLWIDAERAREENTMTLYYEVSVGMNGTGPVALLLPAPGDERFWDALNVTNGSSTLRLDHTASDTSVVLTAYGNVTFRVQVGVSPLGNWSFTRVTYASDGTRGPTSNATIEMSTASSETAVLLSVDASIGTVCESYFLFIDAAVHAGVGKYPTESGLMVC